MESKKVKNCYDAVASAYAVELFDELAKKPLDRLLLKQFAAENKGRGKMTDLGCGPGQIARFLADNGVKDILGTDISPGMIAEAKELSPDLQFQTADMLKLDFPEGYFASAVAFYAIVHFNAEQLEKAFNEIYRVLKPGGQFLLSFHIGEGIVHRDEFFGEQVDIDFYFFQTEEILKLLKDAGFKVLDAIERYPYVGVEYPSRRAYLWVEK
ncbi:MAG TPA: class I SAM-dependent methyltransferase [Mucilaginibacter sp.]|nr:class I SAM-dependent methyltransferase [Mucilaginibacter sp.]